MSTNTDKLARMGIVHSAPTSGNVSAEQQARDMLERMGVEDAQSWSAGELVELANLIANRHPPVQPPEVVAWAFRYRGRFGNVDWTPWGASFGPEKPNIEHAECESYPLCPCTHAPVQPTEPK